MDVLRRMKSMIAVLFVLFMSYSVTLAFAGNAEDGQLVKWKRIKGVSHPINVVAGVESTGVGWSTTRGWAEVNLQDGLLQFKVKGLVLSGQPQGPNPGRLVIGAPSPGITAVKSTIVCNAAEPFPYTNVVLVDSDPVPLSRTGNANFLGEIGLPPVCDDMAFLIRGANPGPIFDLWIAHGAVRTSKALHDF